MDESEQREQEIVKGMEQDRKTAEQFVLNYDNKRKTYDDRKQEWLNANNAPAGEKVGGKTNLPGSPTENAAIKVAQYDMEHPEYLWLRAVEIALKTFGERKRIFITVRREADRRAQSYHGKKSWVVFTQRRYSEEIAKRYIFDEGGWVSDRTIKKWWALILDRVVEIHLRLKKN